MALPTASDSASTSLDRRNPIGKIPPPPGLAAPKPVPRSQPRNTNHSTMTRSRAMQLSSSSDSSTTSVPSTAHLNGIANIPLHSGLPVAPQTIHVGPRFAYMNAITNSHGDTNNGYPTPSTTTMALAAMGLSHFPADGLAMAFERNNACVRNLLPTPPLPQPSSAFRVHLPQPQAYLRPHLNGHPSSLPPAPSAEAPLSSFACAPQHPMHPSHPLKQEKEQEQEQDRREVCMKWLKGHCDRHPCLYAHDQNAPRPPEQRRVCVCAKWLKGECDKDPSECRYLHDENAPRPNQVCMRWLKGECDKDPSECLFLHDQNAPRPRCMYWSKGTCYDRACPFSHEYGRSRAPFSGAVSRKDPLPHSTPNPSAPSDTENKQDSSSKPSPLLPPDTVTRKDQNPPPSDTETKKVTPSKPSPSPLDTEAKKVPLSKPNHSTPMDTETKKDTPSKWNPSVSIDTETKKDSPPKRNPVPPSETDAKKVLVSKPHPVPSSDIEIKKVSASKPTPVPSPDTERKKVPTSKPNPVPSSDIEIKKVSASKPNHVPPPDTERKKVLTSKPNPAPPSDTEAKKIPLSKPNPPSPSNVRSPVSVDSNGKCETAAKPTEPSPHFESKSTEKSETVVKPAEPQQQPSDKQRRGCINWLIGTCDEGPSICQYAHDPNAPRPSCCYGVYCRRPLCYFYHKGRPLRMPPSHLETKKDPFPRSHPGSTALSNDGVTASVGNTEKCETGAKPTEPSRPSEPKSTEKREAVVKPAEPQRLPAAKSAGKSEVPPRGPSVAENIKDSPLLSKPSAAFSSGIKGPASVSSNGKRETVVKPAELSRHPEPKAVEKREAVKPTESSRLPEAKSTRKSDVPSRGSSDSGNRQILPTLSKPNPGTPSDAKEPTSVGDHGKRDAAVKPVEPSRHPDPKTGKGDTVMKPVEPSRHPESKAGKHYTTMKRVEPHRSSEPKAAGKQEAVVEPTELSRLPEPRKRESVVKPTEPRQLPEPIFAKKHDKAVKSAEPFRPPEPMFATTIADHIKVRFGRGFDVQEVTTGFESRWVHLGNVKSNIPKDAISQLLEKYGQVDQLNAPVAPTQRSMTVKAQFSSPSEAVKAVTDLNGFEFHGQHLTARVSINNSLRGTMTIDDTDVLVTWQFPRRMGYAGYATLKEAKAAMEAASAAPMHDSIITADLYDGLPAVGAYNVVLRHLPAQTTEKDIRRLGNAESIMLERPNYTSLERAKQIIQSILEEYGTVISFNMLPPPYNHGLVKAWVKFSTFAEARAAQDYLDNKTDLSFLGRTPLYVRHVLSITHPFPYPVYDKLREDITWLRGSWTQRYGPGITLAERGNTKGLAEGGVFIRVSCEDVTLLSHLKYEFEQLTRGETVMFDKKPIWDDFLISSAGTSFLDRLQQQYPGVEIQLHRTRRVVTVLGSIMRRHAAKQEIIRKLVDVKSLQHWSIPFVGKSLGLFLSEDLLRLQENLGVDNCFFDFSKRSLVVRGNEQTFHIACKAVQDAQDRRGTDSCSTGTICPVCLSEAVVPTSLPCGHQWCRSCLMGYLGAAVDTKTFPLTCLGDDSSCTEPIPLSLARELLSTSEFDAVIEAAFWTHVHSRPDEFHHCPAPDCTQIYRSAPRNTILQCPSCLVRICPACHIEYHDGLTCEERDVADDKLFAEWRSNNDVKSCPVCRVPIERSEGCNHMTCTRCQSHICWQCLAIFPKGEGIYDHMRRVHGSIGL